MDYKGKKVLLRVDLNVPLDSENRVSDPTRIEKAVPTINHIREQGGAVILMSHLGRPQKKRNADGSLNTAKFTLRHIVPALEEAIGTEVQFADDCIGEDAKQKSAALKEGEVLLLENTRFHPGEEKGDEEMAKALATLGDLYVNDAFGTAHRAHASTAVIADFFEKGKKGFGQLMGEEVEAAEMVLNSKATPFVVILGGAKVSDKIGLIERFSELADHILIGGAMAYTFIKARGGEVGNSLVEEDRLDLALSLMEKAALQNCQLHLPVDSIAADSFDRDAAHREAPSDAIPEGWMGLDIGPKAAKSYAEIITSAKKILWNGPMGVFEFPNFANGTLAVANAVAEATANGAYSMVGGGDSVAAVNQSGKSEAVSFISTGGGAMLEYLEGKELPGIKAMK